MWRNAEVFLAEWIQDPKRKPLILRGARQVGKSTLVRNFAKKEGYELFELNLEKLPLLSESFKTKNPLKIIKDCSIYLGREISPHKSILFFDEIQAIPEALAALRYFYEETPEINVISAGSLLDVVLSEHEFSMPVGRVSFLNIGPMLFSEFLIALGQTSLLEEIQNIKKNEVISEVAHESLLSLLSDYYQVGGMPEAVLSYIEKKDFKKVREIQNALIETYRNDFGKYRKKIPQIRLERIFDYASLHLGQKVKYSEISREDQARELKPALELLERAKVIHRVYHSDCQGVPLKAGINEKIFKLLFLDIGLINAMRETPFHFLTGKNQHAKHLGHLAEQFIGQHLLYADKAYFSSGLFYWIREGKSGNAEIDYVITREGKVIPVEVKSGKSGSMKSIAQFIYEKKSHLAIRLDLNRNSIQKVSHQTSHSKKTIQFEIQSLPLYAVEIL